MLNIISDASRLETTPREFISLVVSDVTYRMESDVHHILYMLWGAPGTGKTRGVIPALKQALDDTTGEDWVINSNFRGMNVDPVDLRGLPRIDAKAKVVEWVQAGFLPNVERDGEYVILVIEEFYLNPEVIGVFMELTGERGVGEYRLPKNCIIIGLTNRPEDNSNVRHGNSMAQDNRAEHYTLRLSLEEFIEDVCIPQDWDPRVPAFLNWKGVSYLHEFPNGCPPGVAKKRIAYATPRSWEKVSHRGKQNLPPDLFMKACAACLGKDIGMEYFAFCRLYDELPDTQQYWDNPEGAPLPAKLDILWATMGRLSNTIDNDTERFAAFTTVAKRCPEEMLQPVMADAVKRWPDMMVTDTFIQFSVDYAHLKFAA